MTASGTHGGKKRALLPMLAIGNDRNTLPKFSKKIHELLPFFILKLDLKHTNKQSVYVIYKRVYCLCTCICYTHIYANTNIHMNSLKSKDSLLCILCFEENAFQFQLQLHVNSVPPCFHCSMASNQKYLISNSIEKETNHVAFYISYLNNFVCFMH